VDQLKFGHTFVQNTENDTFFCEYCFKRLEFTKVDKNDDSLAYKCEGNEFKYILKLKILKN